METIFLSLSLALKYFLIFSNHISSLFKHAFSIPFYISLLIYEISFTTFKSF